MSFNISTKINNLYQLIKNVDENSIKNPLTEDLDVNNNKIVNTVSIELNNNTISTNQDGIITVNNVPIQSGESGVASVGGGSNITISGNPNVNPVVNLNTTISGLTSLDSQALTVGGSAVALASQIPQNIVEEITSNDGTVSIVKTGNSVDLSVEKIPYITYGLGLEEITTGPGEYLINNTGVVGITPGTNISVSAIDPNTGLITVNATGIQSVSSTDPNITATTTNGAVSLDLNNQPTFNSVNLNVGGAGSATPNIGVGIGPYTGCLTVKGGTTDNGNILQLTSNDLTQNAIIGFNTNGGLLTNSLELAVLELGNNVSVVSDPTEGLKVISSNGLIMNDGGITIQGAGNGLNFDTGAEAGQFAGIKWDFTNLRYSNAINTEGPTDSYLLEARHLLAGSNITLTPDNIGRITVASTASGIQSVSSNDPNLTATTTNNAVSLDFSNTPSFTSVSTNQITSSGRLQNNNNQIAYLSDIGASLAVITNNQGNYTIQQSDLGNCVLLSAPANNTTYTITLTNIPSAPAGAVLYIGRNPNDTSVGSSYNIVFGQYTLATIGTSLPTSSILGFMISTNIGGYSTWELLGQKLNAGGNISFTGTSDNLTINSAPNLNNTDSNIVISGQNVNLNPNLNTMNSILFSATPPQGVQPYNQGQIATYGQNGGMYLGSNSFVNITDLGQTQNIVSQFNPNKNGNNIFTLFNKGNPSASADMYVNSNSQICVPNLNLLNGSANCLLDSDSNGNLTMNGNYFYSYGYNLQSIKTLGTPQPGIAYTVQMSDLGSLIPLAAGASGATYIINLPSFTSAQLNGLDGVYVKFVSYFFSTTPATVQLVNAWNSYVVSTFSIGGYGDVITAYLMFQNTNNSVWTTDDLTRTSVSSSLYSITDSTGITSQINEFRNYDKENTIRIKSSNDLESYNLPISGIKSGLMIKFKTHITSKKVLIKDTVNSIDYYLEKDDSISFKYNGSIWELL